MPPPFYALVPCPACGCHARPTEPRCPSCGATLRATDGSVPRTRVAVLMGLTAALLQPQSLACGGSDERDPWSDDGGKGGDGNIGSAYGVGPSTGGFGPSTGGFGAGGEGAGGEGGLGEGGADEGGAQNGGAGG